MAASRHFEFLKLDTKSEISFLHKAKQATNILFNAKYQEG